MAVPSKILEKIIHEMSFHCFSIWFFQYVKQILHLRFYNQRKIFQSKIVHLNPEFPQGLGKRISQLSVYAMHDLLIACDNDSKLKTKMRI